MTIRELLARKQRNCMISIFVAWLAGVLASAALRPEWALFVLVTTLSVMIAALVYLHRSARCPRCAAKLWLSQHKMVPLGPFRPKIDHCPSCGISVSESAQA